MIWARLLALITMIVLGGGLSAPLPARADQLQDIKSRGKLVCGTLGTFEPFSFQDPATREIVGYDVDIAAPSRTFGVPLEVKPIAVEARIPELIQGRVDILGGDGLFRRPGAQIGYSKTYFVSRQRILVRKDDRHRQCPADKKISAIKGSDTEAFIRHSSRRRRP